jgi:hypothetical protein
MGSRFQGAVQPPEITADPSLDNNYKLQYKYYDL